VPRRDGGGGVVVVARGWAPDGFAFLPVHPPLPLVVHTAFHEIFYHGKRTTLFPHIVIDGFLLTSTLKF